MRSRAGINDPSTALFIFLRAAAQFWILDFGLGLPGEAFNDNGDPFRSGRSRPKQVPARLYARTAPGAGPRPCFEGAQFVSKMRTGFRKCASWKSPKIPSKMRTLFQGAHEKLRIFRKGTGSVTGSGRLASPVWHTQRSLPGAVLTHRNGFEKRRPLAFAPLSLHADFSHLHSRPTQSARTIVMVRFTPWVITGAAFACAVVGCA